MNNHESDRAAALVSTKQMELATARRKTGDAIAACRTLARSVVLPAADLVRVRTALAALEALAQTNGWEFPDPARVAKPKPEST